MSWSHAEAMQGWEDAEERESWARCDAEKWRELAQELATALKSAEKHMTSSNWLIMDAIANAKAAGLEVGA